MKKHLKGGVALLSLSAVLLLAACDQQQSGSVKLEGTEGTAAWHVTLADLDAKADAQTVQAGLERSLAATNQRIGAWDKNSEISHFNQSTRTDWFPVSPELAKLVASTLDISQQSGGFYDVTVGPLVNLWGFSASQAGKGVVPTQAEIDAARAKVGYQKLQVRLDPPALRKSQPDVYVDLSSVADGFAADQAGEYLESLGIHQYMVEVAGEIRTRGLSPRGDAWKIAIEKPLDEGLEAQQGIMLHDNGLATSGDYHNFFIKDGKRYSHTFDPNTGYPVADRLASVSVLEPYARLSDEYSTTLKAMGEVKGKAFAEAHGIPAFFIVRTDKGFETYATEAFKRSMMKE